MHLLAGNALYILLTTNDTNNASEVKAILEKDIVGLIDFAEVQIPKRKPITRAQYSAAKVLWPTQFHENKRLRVSLCLY